MKILVPSIKGMRYLPVDQLKKINENTRGWYSDDQVQRAAELLQQEEETS